MKPYTLTALLGATLLSLSTLVQADAGHSAPKMMDHSDMEEMGGHHDEHSETFMSGRPGNPEHVDRVIRVTAADTMRFDPPHFQVRPGETIRFVVTNQGKIDHEFVVGTRDEHSEHRKEMREQMGAGMMDHEDPNAITVPPGETRELIWTFNQASDIQAACNLPGHYEAGMHADINVTGKPLDKK